MIYALGDQAPAFDGDDHFIAANATLIGNVHVAAGASIWFGAILRGDNDRITIGRDSNVQDGAILHTDPGMPLTVGERVTIGHRVMLHGCTIGDESLIGIGSTVLNHAKIGRQCLVGAHALITEGKEFPDGVLIHGSPARIVRELSAQERAMLSQSAEVYVANGKRFREQLVAADALPGEPSGRN